MARDNAPFAIFLREFIKEIEDNPPQSAKAGAGFCLIAAVWQNI